MIILWRRLFSFCNSVISSLTVSLRDSKSSASLISSLASPIPSLTVNSFLTCSCPSPKVQKNKTMLGLLGVYCHCKSVTGISWLPDGREKPGQTQRTDWWTPRPLVWYLERLTLMICIAMWTHVSSVRLVVRSWRP